MIYEIVVTVLLFWVKLIRSRSNVTFFFNMAWSKPRSQVNMALYIIETPIDQFGNLTWQTPISFLCVLTSLGEGSVLKSMSSLF